MAVAVQDAKLVSQKKNTQLDKRLCVYTEVRVEERNEVNEENGKMGKWENEEIGEGRIESEPRETVVAGRRCLAGNRTGDGINPRIHV